MPPSTPAMSLYRFAFNPSGVTCSSVVSAAVPMALALAIKERDIKSGDKIVLMGYGSGLNALFSGIIW